jgi:hypothetical protein
VRPGDGQRALLRADLREQLAAVQLAQPARGGRGALGVVRPDGGGHDHLDVVPGGDVRRRVPDDRDDPLLAQRLEVGGVRAIRPGHLRAERARDEREAAHPGAADPHEMQSSS